MPPGSVRFPGTYTVVVGVQARTAGFMVGPVRVDPPVLLAPMEDVTNLPFRLIAKRIGGPGLMFTEFVSAMAARFAPEKAIKKMRVHAEERPLGIQIFGGDPKAMVEIARVAEGLGADLIDINMGCWVPKVCRTGAGAALLKDPDLAEQIVRQVVRSVRVPVTVKVRAGWDYSLFAAPELAKRFEGAGAEMLTLHARFAKQGFHGEADWRLIEDLRRAIAIPLIGNGDVRTPEDAVRMMRDTGCDGVMVGRAAISNPWALASLAAAMLGNSPPPPPGIGERIEVALEHLRRMIQFESGLEQAEEAFGTEAELRAVRRLRGQIPMYIKGEPGAAQMREAVTRCGSYQEVEAILRRFEETIGSQADGSRVE